VLKIANPQFFMFDPQIENPQISLACSNPLIPNPHNFYSEGETPFFKSLLPFRPLHGKIS
jgi:hypothetical protein